MKHNKSQSSKESLTRVAIVSSEHCKPDKCSFECKKSCPVVKMGKQCIVVSSNSGIARIAENLCNGCGICVKKCPFKAIRIEKIAAGLEKEISHRFGENSFRLHRLPIPRRGQVLGLLGANGTGKTTVIKILSGAIKPNLGNYKDPPNWSDIIDRYHGSELHSLLLHVCQSDWKATVKPQYVDRMSEIMNYRLGDLLNDKLLNQADLIKTMELEHLSDRQVNQLSGGEMQRLACALCCGTNSQIHLFDEPSCYLDVRQRVKVCRLIHQLQIKATHQNDLSEEHNNKQAEAGGNNKNGHMYTVVVEHDLAMLDCMADNLCLLYGQSGVYGVVSRPLSVLKGINVFLDGYLPTENVRFRDQALVFTPSDLSDNDIENHIETINYEEMNKDFYSNDNDTNSTTFSLLIEAGKFSMSEITVLLGENGMGKTTFLKLLATHQTLTISEKLQKVYVKNNKMNLTVDNVIHKRINSETMNDAVFIAEVFKPLQIDLLRDQRLVDLSGGELQRLALALCLGKPAQLYLIDEPSAHLDCEQRFICARVIKRFTRHMHRAAFIVEHDLLMANYLADQVIVFTGTAGQQAIAHSPQSLLSGMNLFLKELNITFRRDARHHRPRVNRLDSTRDLEQKRLGQYFFVETN